MDRCHPCHRHAADVNCSSCFQSNYQLPNKGNSISIDSMNYLLLDNGECNGQWNADNVPATNIPIDRQQTNNESHKINSYIDFNEINDFRKRYADECISPLNESCVAYGNGQLTENVRSKRSTSMDSLRHHNDDSYNFDWSEMKQLFHGCVANGLWTNEREHSPHQIELIKPSSSAAVSFDGSKNSFALRHQATKE